MLDRVCMKRRIIKRLMSLSKQLGMFSIILLIDHFFSHSDYFRNSVFKSKTRRRVFLPVSFAFSIEYEIELII